MGETLVNVTSDVFSRVAICVAVWFSVSELLDLYC